MTLRRRRRLGGGGVSAPVATKLTITTQPANASSGTPFGTQPVVEIQTAGGGRVTSSTAPVTVAIDHGPGTLTGTLTVNAVAGVATFTDLTITLP